MIKPKSKVKTLLTSLAMVAMLFQSSIAFAMAAPSAPSAPTAPSGPSSVSAPSSPSTPEAPQGPQSPASPAAPSAPSAPTAPQSPDKPSAPEAPQAPATPKPSPSSSTNSPATPLPEPVKTNGPEPTTPPTAATTSDQSAATGSSADGQVGDASVTTGNATNTASVSTAANNNSSVARGGQGGIAVKNADNGADSNNSATVNNDSDTETNQGNSASVVNNLNQSTTTGGNSTSRNTNGDSTITTGNANTTGTVITSVNTNLDGVGVHEFNVADDYNGDIILQFAPVNRVEAVNQNNGAGSDNDLAINNSSSDSTFQNNDADILNNVVLASDTGHNSASRNTGGDSTITTGDANVSANIVTLANNNIAGNLVYAVVNIFGDLVGNIILPEEQVNSLMAASKDNGVNSQNNTNINLADSQTVNQFNNADIQNNLVFDANTGNNDTSSNTGGNSSVTTGSANIDAQVVNVANLNLVDGNAWLVIVNEAGNWIGRIIGSDGNVFGSTLLEFAMGSDGTINVTNSGNGADSTNNVAVNQDTKTEVIQENNATIVNKVELSANTGGNDASRNTNGNSSIETGDANIIANLVNFANTNIAAGSSLMVTVINVFGSWMGDFFGPHANPPVADDNETNPQGNSGNHNEVARGGQSTVNTNNSSSTQNNTVADHVVNQTPAPKTQTLVSSVVGNVRGAVGQILDEASSDVNAQGPASEEVLGETDEKKDVNINLAWGIPFGAILLCGEYLRRRFLG